MKSSDLLVQLLYGAPALPAQVHRGFHKTATTVRSLLLVLLLTAVMPAGAAVQGVLPGGFANTEGNGSSADLFRTTSTTFQQVYAASEFNFIGAGTGRIDGISFRFDGASGQSFSGIWPGLSVILSTTTRSPDFLSSHFGDNAGADAVQVFGGPLIISAPGSPGVRAFQVRIPFTTPFFYEPSRGNLSAYFVSSPGTTSLLLDGQLVAGDSVGRVFGDGLRTCARINSDLGAEGECSSIAARKDVGGGPVHRLVAWRLELWWGNAWC